jgi:16S rRNA (uracil1498-N3)-methyltransferase
LGIVLSERNEKSQSLGKILNQKEIQEICIAVGNEGGVSPEEIDLLTKKSLFCAVHFDVNILRCETAALYGIAAVQSFMQEK